MCGGHQGRAGGDNQKIQIWSFVGRKYGLIFEKGETLILVGNSWERQGGIWSFVPGVGISREGKASIFVYGSQGHSLIFSWKCKHESHRRRSFTSAQQFKSQ
jgi:hypothetical protein